MSVDPTFASTVVDLTRFRRTGRVVGARVLERLHVENIGSREDAARAAADLFVSGSTSSEVDALKGAAIALNHKPSRKVGRASSSFLIDPSPQNLGALAAAYNPTETVNALIQKINGGATLSDDHLILLETINKTHKLPLKNHPHYRTLEIALQDAMRIGRADVRAWIGSELMALGIERGLVQPVSIEALGAKVALGAQITDSQWLRLYASHHRSPIGLKLRGAPYHEQNKYLDTTIAMAASGDPGSRKRIESNMFADRISQGKTPVVDINSLSRQLDEGRALTDHQLSHLYATGITQHNSMGVFNRFYHNETVTDVAHRAVVNNDIDSRMTLEADILRAGIDNDIVAPYEATTLRHQMLEGKSLTRGQWLRLYATVRDRRLLDMFYVTRPTAVEGTLRKAVLGDTNAQREIRYLIVRNIQPG